MNTTATSPVFITVPKYVTISNGALPKIRPAPSASPTSSGYSSSSANSMDDCTPPKGKKRRLDHLSWEEKVQRKKLKNRVAAQTSRDRKKARMEEMEYEIKSLNQTAEMLENKCESLQAINDSLLEKNQKLDMEVELLRQQVTELQQQQKEQTTGYSKVVESCAGSGINNGLTVDTKSTTKEQHDGSTLEDCCPLPALQDMLLLDEEFDASKLEELAESLLADIAADMESSNRKCNEAIAEATSRAERLPGPMVGTETERLESSEHSTRNSCIESTTSEEQHNNLVLPSELQTIKCEESNQTEIPVPVVTSNNNDEIATEPIIITATPNDAYDNVVYGNYDAKTNSITIVMDDDAEAVNEAVEEIYCDGVTPPVADDVIDCPSPVASPSQVYLNVDCSDNENDVDVENDLNFDPIVKFLQPRRPLISPLGKSPAPSLYSATSDHGYESVMGSPPISASEHFQSSSIIGTDIDDVDFSWNDSLDELFPTLI